MGLSSPLEIDCLVLQENDVPWHMTNPSLNMLIASQWLDISYLGTLTAHVSGCKHAKTRSWSISIQPS